MSEQSRDKVTSLVQTTNSQLLAATVKPISAMQRANGTVDFNPNSTGDDGVVHARHLNRQRYLLGFREIFIDQELERAARRRRRKQRSRRGT